MRTEDSGPTDVAMRIAKGEILESIGKFMVLHKSIPIVGATAM